MPSVPFKKSSKPAAYSTFEDTDSVVAEQDSATQTSQKKGRNAPARQTYAFHEELPDEEVTRPKSPSPSPSRPRSILGQTTRAFGRKDPPLDVLDALGTSQKVSDQYPTRTDEWAREIPYGKSPPGETQAGLSVSGSPLVGPAHLGRGGFSTRSPPVSPAQRLARPVSYGGNIPPLPVRQNLSDQSYRYTPSAYGSPPAPHQPQPHFYAATDVDLGLGRGIPQMMASEPSFVAFGPAPFLEIAPSRRVQPAILLGSEGRLDVLVSLPNKVEPLGALHGLPGTVVDARFLTWEFGLDPFAEYRPLVALTLHGPKLAEEIDQLANNSDDDYAASVVTAGGQPSNAATPNHLEYQTRVEVYSLGKQCHISTLLKAPPVPIEPTFRGQAQQYPEPVGHLRIDVNGNFVTISSGVSGEVYVFGVNTTPNPSFECLAKLWTSVQPQFQRRDSSHSRSADADISPADLNRRNNLSEAPVASLSGRWLAIVSATSPSRPTLGASLGLTVVQKRISSRDLRSAPSRPSVTCEVDSPDVDTLLSKAVREVAQGVARGARWFADQGMQTWNNYWKKDQPPSLSPRPAYDARFYPPQALPPQFPPTHSAETQTNTREQDLVSIYDLKALQNSCGKQKADDPKPVATFQPPGGCSFLSFMPNGLGLLTVSRKGDVQYVWDLMQIRHCRSAGVVADNTLSETSTSPRVRQLAKFPRLTTSTVIDVVWESAVGDRFALVTKNGTVHACDLPITAFRWPPPRRTKKSRPTSAPVDAMTLGASDEPLPTSGILAQAINIAGKTQPIFANLRGRAPSMSTGIGGIGNTGIGLASATGVKGGRAVAAGLSKSLGAATGTVNHIRGENRLHLRSLTNDPTPGRVAWDVRGSRAVICVLDKAAVRSYYVRRSKPRENNRQQRASVFDTRKAAGLKLPEISSLINKSNTSQAPANLEIDQTGHAVLGWCSPKIMRPAPTSGGVLHPLSHAEIDTNAPYQPFHSDGRVNLSIYPEGQELAESHYPTASAIFEPAQAATPTNPEQWVFGHPIPSIQLRTHTTGDSLYADSGSVIYRETTTSPTKDGNAENIAKAIVSTTRRRKKKPEAPQMESGEDFDHEGFFEDDCDVLDSAGDRV